MNTKKFTHRFLLCFFLISSLVIFKATAQEPCGTMEHEQMLEKKNPQRVPDRQQSEMILQQWIADHADASSLRSADTIPVVVHVLWHTNGENIDSAQVQSQIDVLNEDFGRLSADTINTPADFLSVAASIPFRFCLAERDQFGNPTNGIERRFVSSVSVGGDYQIKTYDGGGLDAWDVTKYMNIWVVNFGNTGLLGYAEFPTSNPSSSFGAVIQYNAFGREGVLLPGYDLGKTTVHEFSHCFNLFHIWGDDGGACNGSDLVADTPNQGDATFGCPSFPHTDNCSPNAPGIMFMNYMDYSNDPCTNMFTQGQATRMSGAINSFYPTLLTSDGCVPGVVFANNASLTSILTPVADGQLCNSDVTPVVTIKNWGSDTLTAITISYFIDNNPVQSYAWSGTLSYLATTEVTLPLLSTTIGTHTFTAYTESPNGEVDPFTVNDSATISFNINLTVVSLPQQEGFQPTLFPPENWYYTYPNPSNRWKRVSNVGGFGNSTAAAKMDNFAGNTDISGQVDDLIMPNMNFTNASDSILLTFNVAYAQYDNNTIDSLVVRATADCGVTWTTLFHKGGSLLSTAPDKTTAFTPTATQWKAYSLSLSEFAGQPEVQIVFRSVSNWGNNLYLDDIFLGNQVVGISNFDIATSINLFPNPAGDFVTISLSSEFITADLKISVKNALGKTVREIGAKAGISDITIPTADLSAGIYFVSLSDGKILYTTKLIKE
ncbi:MAG: M43 family zinc metalloprotease [Chitinophagales bacterium]